MSTPVPFQALTDPNHVLLLAQETVCGPPQPCAAAAACSVGGSISAVWRWSRHALFEPQLLRVIAMYAESPKMLSVKPFPINKFVIDGSRQQLYVFSGAQFAQFDLRSGNRTMLHPPDGFDQSGVTDACFDPDMQTLLKVSRFSGRLHVWHLPSNTATQLFDVAPGYCEFMGIVWLGAPHHCAVTCTADGLVEVWKPCGGLQQGMRLPVVVRDDNAKCEYQLRLTCVAWDSAAQELFVYGSSTLTTKQHKVWVMSATLEIKRVLHLHGSDVVDLIRAAVAPVTPEAWRLARMFYMVIHPTQPKLLVSNGVDGKLWAFSTETGKWAGPLLPRLCPKRTSEQIQHLATSNGKGRRKHVYVAHAQNVIIYPAGLV